MIKAIRASMYSFHTWRTHYSDVPSGLSSHIVKLDRICEVLVDTLHLPQHLIDNSASTFVTMCGGDYLNLNVRCSMSVQVGW